MSDDKKPYHIQPTGSRICADEAAAIQTVLDLIAASPTTRIWLVRGVLGAGKTTLARGVAKAFGVQKNVTSPTYTLRQEYPIQRGSYHLFVHIDAYRIRSIVEVDGIGITDDLQNPGAFVWVEWPERINELPISGAAHLEISIVPRGRKLTWLLPTAA
jgi:tRNA threonylcarbamoyladenosine biosynthesis protein TsaE